MARPKGSKNKSKGTDNGSGHNANGGLTDEQRRALLFNQHLPKYEAMLAEKKAADAAFKNACKAARAELGESAIDEIKDVLLLRTEKGEAILQARVERQLRIARYMNLPLGAQLDLFGDAMVDRRPATERAFEEGKNSALRGETLKPPHAPEVPQHDAYIEGYHVGQKEVFAIKRRRDGALFDVSDDDSNASIGSEEATFVEA